MTEGAVHARGRWLGVGLALALAVLGLAVGSAAAARGGWDVLGALVPALVFWGGLSAGSLVLLLVHRLTGGQWGEDLRRPLLAAAGALPVVALLAAPLLLGLDGSRTGLYPWAATAEAASAQHWYLSPPGFTARTLAILALWLLLAWSVGAYGPSSKSLPRAGASAFSLLLMVVSMTLIAFDWVMSLDPEWYSAVFGLLVGVAGTLTAMALAALWLGLHPPRVEPRSHGGATARLSPDAGNLLLALLLLWGYLALMQLVTIWIANLPEEIRWLVPRLQTNWRWLGLAWVILLAGLALPLLLARRVKTRPGGLALAAGVVLLGQGLYALWLTLPTLRPAGLMLTPLDLAVLAGAGALWLAGFVLHLVGSRALDGPATRVRRERALAAPPEVGQLGGAPAVAGEVAVVAPTAARAAALLSSGSLAEARGHALALAGDSRRVGLPVAAGPRFSTAPEREPSDIAAGAVIKILAWIAALVVIAATVLLPWRHQEGPNPQPPQAGPTLLARPVASLADFRAAQRRQLLDWAWVSREDGIARIPVDRAIELLLARGQPSTPSQEERQ